MVAEGCQAGKLPIENNNIKVTYTNIDGLVSGIVELKDYLQERKPEVVCLTETKLKEDYNWI